MIYRAGNTVVVFDDTGLILMTGGDAFPHLSTTATDRQYQFGEAIDDKAQYVPAEEVVVVLDDDPGPDQVLVPVPGTLKLRLLDADLGKVVATGEARPSLAKSLWRAFSNASSRLRAITLK